MAQPDYSIETKICWDDEVLGTVWAVLRTFICARTPLKFADEGEGE